MRTITVINFAGPYPVMKVKGKTVVWKRANNIVELFSSDCGTHAPAPCTAEE